MKVAFISQPYDSVVPPVQKGSIAIWTYEVARRLARSGPVVVYARRGASQSARELDQGVEYRRISVARDETALRWFERVRRICPSGMPLYGSRLYYLNYILKAANDARENLCDVVHVHNCFSFIPVIRRLNPHARIVLHMHCEWLSQLPARSVGQRLKSANRVLACSDYVTFGVRRRFPHWADNCRTLYNGVDVDRFGSDGNGGPNGADGPTILFVNRVSPEKGVHVLIDAFTRVARKRPSARLKIIGPQRAADLGFIIAPSRDPRVRALSRFYPGDYLTQLRALVPKELSERVSMLGQVPHADLAAHYHDAAMLVSPSLWEPFGMTLIEAMASGRAVVASRTGGMPEVVQDGRTGLLVEPGDPSALAGAIERLLDEPALRHSMGQAGRQRAAEHFSWDRITDNLRAQYEQLMAPGYSRSLS